MELNEFINNFSEVFDDTEVDVFTPDCNYQELEEWGSLTALGIIAFVKTQYNKKITGQEIRSCQTIEELFNLIKNK